MTTPFDNSEQIARVKSGAISELGQHITGFALQFAEPVIIGTVPTRGKETTLNNATATLLRIASREFAVTCAHVLQEFRNKRDVDERKFVFQVGMLGVNPEDQLVGYDEVLDLAVLEITGLRHAHASSRPRNGPFQFHEPHRWPPAIASDREVVSIAGYPGAWRQPLSDDHITFDTFSIGAQPVTSSQRNSLALQFNREHWVSSFGDRGKDIKLLGGMSGGPIMVMRPLNWDLAGIITHFSEDWDVLFGAPTLRIRADGTIDPE